MNLKIIYLLISACHTGLLQGWERFVVVVAIVVFVAIAFVWQNYNVCAVAKWMKVAERREHNSRFPKHKENTKQIIPFKNSNFSRSSLQAVCKTISSPCEGTGHPQYGWRHLLVFMCWRERFADSMNAPFRFLHSFLAIIFASSSPLSGIKHIDVLTCMIVLYFVHMNPSSHDLLKYNAFVPFFRARQRPL